MEFPKNRREAREINELDRGYRLILSKEGGIREDRARNCLVVIRSGTEIYLLEGAGFGMVQSNQAIVEAFLADFLPDCKIKAVYGIKYFVSSK